MQHIPNVDSKKPKRTEITLPIDQAIPIACEFLDNISMRNFFLASYSMHNEFKGSLDVRREEYTVANQKIQDYASEHTIEKFIFQDNGKKRLMICFGYDCEAMSNAPMKSLLGDDEKILPRLKYALIRKFIWPHLSGEKSLDEVYKGFNKGLISRGGLTRNYDIYTTPISCEVNLQEQGESEFEDKGDNSFENLIKEIITLALRHEALKVAYGQGGLRVTVNADPLSFLATGSQGGAGVNHENADANRCVIC